MTTESGAYLLALIDIHDRERYREYEAGFMAIFERHRGSLLSVVAGT